MKRQVIVACFEHDELKGDIVMKTVDKLILSSATVNNAKGMGVNPVKVRKLVENVLRRAEAIAWEGGDELAVCKVGMIADLERLAGFEKIVYKYFQYMGFTLELRPYNTDGEFEGIDGYDMVVKW